MAHQQPLPYATALPYAAASGGGRPGMPMAYADATGFFGGAATMSPYGTVMAPPYAAAYAMAPSAASPPPKREPVMVKEGPLYFNDSAAWKKLYCSLQSDGRLGFSERQDKKQEKTINLTASAVVKLEDGYIAVDVPGETKFFLNAINQAALKEWLNALNDVIKINKEMQYQYNTYHYHTAAQAQAQALTQSPPASAVYGHMAASAGATVVGGSSGSYIPGPGPVPVPPIPTHIQNLRESHKSGSGLRLSGSGNPELAAAAAAAASEQLAAPTSGQLMRRGSLGKDPKQLPAAPAASKPANGPSRLSGGAIDVSSVAPASPRDRKESDEVTRLKKEVERLQLANIELTRKLEKAQKDASAGPVRTTSASDLIGKASVEFMVADTGINIDVKRDTVEFHERLGGGGSGANVYRCTVKGLSFAAKVMDLTYAQAADIEPMMKEIAIMTDLRHDNIVRYIGSDCNMAKKEVRLFIELYSGTLRDVIESRTVQGRRFTKREIVDWAFQVSKGLNYLHSKSIIHRDLKSDNVFVTWDGQKNPKSMHIGDFDVSKMVEKGKISFTQNVGTPGFIAPEIMSQSDGSKAQAYGFEADIWSFGMLLFELMTMKRPYHDVAPLQVSETNAQGVRPALPADLDEVEFKDLIKLFKQCTNKKATQRPTSKKLISSLSKM